MKVFFAGNLITDVGPKVSSFSRIEETLKRDTLMERKTGRSNLIAT